MSEMEYTDLTLPSDCLGDSVVLKELILCFWGHILYIRNQIPLPLSNITGDALRKSTGTDNQSRSQVNGDKKLVKFDEKYQSLSLSIDALLLDLENNGESAKLKTVCVIIGPSATSSVREAYFLHFEGPSTLSVLENKKKSNQCKRQLLRTIITNWNPDPKSSPVTNSYLAINIQERPFTLSGIQVDCSSDSFSSSDFTVKEGFKVKLRRRSPAPFHLRISKRPDEKEQESEEKGEEEREIIDLTEPSSEPSPTPPIPDFWLVLRKGIKGIKPKS